MIPRVCTNHVTYTVDVDLDHLAEGLCQIFHYEVTLSDPLPTLCSLESSHCTQPRVKEGGAKATSLRLRNLHRLLRIILHRTFVSFPPFVYLPNLYLYQYGLLDTNFILRIIIQHYFILSLKHSQCLSWKLFQWAPGSL